MNESFLVLLVFVYILVS